MNWKEIFSWYWEQKGVENPERFLEDENGEDNVDPQLLALLCNYLFDNNEETTELISENNQESQNVISEETPRINNTKFN